jgi:hypothetical protein
MDSATKNQILKKKINILRISNGFAVANIVADIKN